MYTTTLTAASPGSGGGGGGGGVIPAPSTYPSVLCVCMDFFSHIDE